MSTTDDIQPDGERGLLKLVRGRLDLRLAPQVGGCIAAFNYLSDEKGKTPILRGAEAVPSSILEAASFPLVPYSNRVRNGCFRFRGREVTLVPNMEGDPSPLHGQGWLAAWTAEEHESDRATLVYRHAAGEWPWAYEARQHFRLDEDGLSLRLSCRNLSGEPMPCGLGQHPYFPCTPETRLDTRVECAWTIDGRVLPVGKVPATGRYDLRDRFVCGQDLDNGFGGWSGSARITDPGLSFAIELSSPTARFFQLYSPPAGGLFVAEPVTHANAALNEPEEMWTELGLAIIGPGEEMALDSRLSVCPA
ncbi:aldose 1-epimerase [Enterovirga sp. GCM10030262]|uniref:aldose 1-epimerase n=1 Tax=Enterovirga sp. GCM10030262 TaxID=3273391 RepID=UPI003608032F